MKIEPPSNHPVRLSNLQVIFIDTPAEGEYDPKISIRVNNVDIYQTKNGNPYTAADIDLNLSTGMTITRNDNIELYAGYEGTETDNKKIAVSYTFGEY